MIPPIVRRPEVQKTFRSVMPNDKPILEMERVPYFRVHYQSLERYIERVFKFHEFDYFMASGCVMGECPEYVVNGELPGDEWVRRANDLRTGKFTKNVPLIFAVLCRDGFIPPGKYVVNTNQLLDPLKVYKQLLETAGSPAHHDCVMFRQNNQRNLAFIQRAKVLDNHVWERIKAQERVPTYGQTGSLREMLQQT